jgi:hypothetical protein
MFLLADKGDIKSTIKFNFADGTDKKIVQLSWANGQVALFASLLFWGFKKAVLNPEDIHHSFTE